MRLELVPCTCNSGLVRVPVCTDPWGYVVDHEIRKCPKCSGKGSVPVDLDVFEEAAVDALLGVPLNSDLASHQLAVLNDLFDELEVVE